MHGKRGLFIISRSLPTYERPSHHSVESGAGWRGSWALYTGPRCPSSMAVAFAGESKSSGRHVKSCQIHPVATPSMSKGHTRKFDDAGIWPQQLVHTTFVGSPVIL